jgi:hypothetical protein
LLGTKKVEMAKSTIGCPRNRIRTFDGTLEPRQETYELLNNRAKKGQFPSRAKIV